MGNSDGIRIPSSILKSLNLKTNDKLESIQVDNKIIIFKSERKQIFLEDRIKEYNGNNLCKEFECDEPRGKEIW